ncbi:MAG: sugar phosphate isomerase/epimerase [Deltaproteobacteria bacterium]|nr:sugar phosphate isomerase/epimerase [Deltaproteobacteria bacterium]
MYLACSTLPFREKGLPDAIRKLANLGFKSVEFCVDSHHSIPEYWKESPEEILKLANSLGIKVNSIHVPLMVESPNISYAELRRTSTGLTKKTIDLAVLLGASFIVQHVRLLKDSLDSKQHAILEEIVPDLGKIAQYAANKGLKLALENVPSATARMLGSSAKEMMDIVNLLPPKTIGICLDVSHCVASGYDPLAALNTININSLISIHASDNFSTQLIDQHLPIGSGDIPWKKLFNTLESRGFQGSFVIEVTGGEEEEKTVVDSLNYLRNLSRFMSHLKVPPIQDSKIPSLGGPERR